MNIDKILNIIRNLNEEGIPTNNASGGAIAGLPPDEPPVKKKRRRETPVGRYGSRRMWIQDLRNK
jgi:hypothetical protein|tara:strand:- start:229 stop:423 length:195 start_codon:yes stop_codon:yes gene_type:complete